MSADSSCPAGRKELVGIGRCSLGRVRGRGAAKSASPHSLPLCNNASCSPSPIVPEAQAIMASVSRVTPRPEIEYPDSDGKPMADHTLQYKWIVVIREGLAAQYGDDPDIFVGANLLWYPVERKLTIRGAPDVMVAFG